MKKFFSTLTLFEWIVLAATICFVAGTLLWFHNAQPTEPVTITIEQPTDLDTTEGADSSDDQSETDAPGILPGEVFDLNTVSEADLTRLPGIGDAKAAAIVAWRTENGPFTSVDQLLEVKGIGEGILGKISPYVTVGQAQE